MKYFISNIVHKAMEENDNFVFFDFDIVFTEPEPLTTSYYSYPLFDLFLYIKEKDPRFYTYIETVRTSLDAWGPNQKEIVDTLGDEGINLLYHYLEDYLLTCNWMEGFYKRQLSLQQQSGKGQEQNAEKAEEILEELEPLAENAFNENKRYRQFCSLVEKEAKRIAVEVYPELLDADVQTIKKFKWVFTDGIIKMYDDLLEYIDSIE